MVGGPGADMATEVTGLVAGPRWVSSARDLWMVTELGGWSMQRVFSVGASVVPRVTLGIPESQWVNTMPYNITKLGVGDGLFKFDVSASFQEL